MLTPSAETKVSIKFAWKTPVVCALNHVSFALAIHRLENQRSIVQYSIVTRALSISYYAMI